MFNRHFVQDLIAYIFVVLLLVPVGLCLVVLYNALN